MANLTCSQEERSPGRAVLDVFPARTLAEQAGTTLHRGVRGTPLCRDDGPAVRSLPHNGATGQPTRRDDPVHLSRFGSRPPLAQSAWSPHSQSPPNDHADWATLGRKGDPEGRSRQNHVLPSAPGHYENATRRLPLISTADADWKVGATKPLLVSAFGCNQPASFLTSSTIGGITSKRSPTMP